MLAAVRSWNVSPKLASSGVPYERRINPEALAALTRSRRATFKFVACGTDDLEEIARLTAEYKLTPTWVMPQAVTTPELLAGMRELADGVLIRGWNLSTRLHILLEGTGVR
jgi:7-carboxy-7-deazaguanine synthase